MKKIDVWEVGLFPNVYFFIMPDIIFCNHMKKTLFAIILLIIATSSSSTSASTTSGTITSPNTFAWSENAGWIDFNASSTAVTITDSELTGYAYSENLGWISLNCSNTSSCGTVDYKVANNAEGTLSGYAWSENAGWIHFAPSTSGVIINSSGEFTGYAYGENIGWINFDIDEGAVTDWRPATSRVSATPTEELSGRRGSRRGFSNNSTLPSTTPSSTATPTTAPFGDASVRTISGPTARDLILNVTGEDVRTLQIFLNTHGFPLATTGFGSSGQETNLFGPLTRAAVARFQAANGITPSVGYFGPKTRSFIQTNY